MACIYKVILRCCLKKQERHEPFLFFIFQISQALSLLQKPRDDRRAGADEKADDAEDDVQLLPEEKNAKTGASMGLRKKMSDASCADVFSIASM